MAAYSKGDRVALAKSQYGSEIPVGAKGYVMRVYGLLTERYSVTFDDYAEGLEDLSTNELFKLPTAP